MIESSYGVSRYGRPGEADTLLIPREFDPDDLKPLVIYLHGAAGNAQTVNRADAARGEYDLIRGICRLGYTVAIGDVGGIHTWGHPTAMAAVEDLRLAVINRGLALPGAAHFIGASMGGDNCIGYYRDFPQNVLSISAIIPAWDLQDIRDFNRLNLAASVNAKWGITAQDPLPPGANPIADVEDYVALGNKLKAWYANNDDIAVPQPVRDFAEVVGAEAIDVGSLGHTQEAIAAAKILHVVEHMKTNEV